MREICATTSALLMLGLLGCMGPEAGQARVSSLTGVPEGKVVVQGSDSSLYSVHDVETSQEGDGFKVSGHVGPAARWNGGPSGHVDIDVVGLDGKIVESTSAPLDPVTASPRVWVERRFRALLPEKPAPGSEVRVMYHPADALCHAGR